MTLVATQVDAVVALARKYQVTRLFVREEGDCQHWPLQGLVMDCSGCDGWQLYLLTAELEAVLDMPVLLVPLSANYGYALRIERRGRRLL